MIEAAEWLQNLPLSQEIAWSGWMFPTIEAIHVIGIALVFGTIAIVDLRLLGVASNSRRVTEVIRDCLRWTWLGFAAAVITGSLMFMANASGYITNTYFLWKMFLLALAGVNMFVFELITARTVADWDEGTIAVPLAGKTAGLLSILLWFSVIAMGRWIGFTAYDIPI